MKASPNPETDLSLVAPLATALSFSSFFYFLRHQQVLLYGDAVAHINIARRVFDSQTPGVVQLGTVWLPLPHLLMMPFLLSRSMWQTGMGGSVPSLLAYVMAVIGVFRLLRRLLLPNSGERAWISRFAVWLGTAIFALNPNLLYLQSTAMTEPLYLALFIWAVVFFSEAIAASRGGAVGDSSRSLLKTGFCLAAACLTRYDGWLLAAVIVATTLGLAWRGSLAAARGAARRLLVISVSAPLLWLGYNALVYHNPLEFANGPYSAKAIEKRTLVQGAPPHPGNGDLRAAFRYFFKSAELNLSKTLFQRFWVGSLLLGTAIALLFQRRLWPLLLLWTPVPFYMLSIAYGGVPIFLPVWWPFSYYNVRYGIEMLPAFAVFTALVAYEGMALLSRGKAQALLAVVLAAFVGGSYFPLFANPPVSRQEALINSRTRVALESQLASLFDELPEAAIYLMYLGDHVGAFERAAIPLRRVINEGNHRPWKRPVDPQGLWEGALAHPASYVDYVVEVGDDEVEQKVEKRELTTIAVIHVSGQPQATISRTRRGNQAR